MKKVVAELVNICIFTKSTDNPYPADDRKMYDAISLAASNVAKEAGGSAPIVVQYCYIYGANNQAVALAAGIDPIFDTPAAYMWARYPGGATAYYVIKRDLKDKTLGVDWTPEEMQPYIAALAFRTKPAPDTLLCKIFPPLCSLGWYVWAAAAGYSIYRTTQARNVGKIVWGAAAVLTSNEFIQRGGLKELQKKIGL